MSIIHLNPNAINLTPGHFAIDKIKQIGERFENLKLIKEWVVEGPYETEDSYYFIVTCKDLKYYETVEIPSEVFLFDEKKLELEISKMVSSAAEQEWSTGVAQVLLEGKDEKEWHKEGKQGSRIIEIG